MLNSEQKQFAVSVDSISDIFRNSRNRYLAELSTLKSDADAVSIMLYSQTESYVFGQAYAAEKVEDIVKRFNDMKGPINYWLKKYDNAIHRCNRLLQTLNDIDTCDLSRNGLIELNEGKARMTQILDALNNWSTQIRKDHEKFAEMEIRISNMHTDAIEYYKDIHTNVFLAVDKSYWQVMANFADEFSQAADGLHGLFTPSVYAHKYIDKWSSIGNTILWTDIILFITGAAIGVWIVGVRYRKRPGELKSYHIISRWLIGWILITIANTLMRLFIIDNPFYQSILALWIDLGILSIVILTSVALRVNVRMIRRTLVCYMPTLFITFATIAFRMSLVNASVIRVFFVPILLIVTILQIIANRKNNRLINKFDCTVSLTSFFVYTASLCIAWSGMYFLSIQIVTFWTIILSAHLFLSCIYTFLKRYEEKKQSEDEEYNKGLLHLTLHHLLMPLFFFVTLYACIFECAHIFNIVDWVNHILNTYFIDRPDTIRISVMRLIIILMSGLFTNFLVRIVKFTLGRIYGKRSTVGAMGMSVQISTIVVWGVFIVIALAILEVNSVGLLAVVSGIMVGIGIALRDTLDCFFCGLTMMMGRVKIGDFIECEGVRGWVRDIQYRTTQVETESGSIISFFNTSFFGKNYRNLTGVSKYERMQICFKIQKDADIREMRKIFIEELTTNIPEIQREPAPQILFVGSHRFYVELMAQVWLPVEDYVRLSSMVKETLFYALKNRGMSNMLEDKRTIRLEQ